MNLSKKISLFILLVTSLVASRSIFSFIDDPEGPNLLIVVVLAAILFSLSLTVYRFSRATNTHLKKLILAVLVQVALVIGAYLYFDATPLVTSERALALIKEKYPEYQSYPSENLPPKRIETIEIEDGWRVGMYVEGSGVRGILRANCFLVSEEGVVVETGQFQGEGPAKSINLKTCTPKE